MANEAKLIRRSNRGGESYSWSEPLLGADLVYDENFHDYSHDYSTADEFYENGELYGDDIWKVKGKAAKEGAKYGLPFRIAGHPLGCGCDEAFLHGIGKLKDGQIEADYVCDVGWHNYAIFKIKEKKKPKKKEVKQEIKLNKFGEVDQVGFTATELEDY